MNKEKDNVVLYAGQVYYKDLLIKAANSAPEVDVVNVIHASDPLPVGPNIVYRHDGKLYALVGAHNCPMISARMVSKHQLKHCAVASADQRMRDAEAAVREGAPSPFQDQQRPYAPRSPYSRPNRTW